MSNKKIAMNFYEYSQNNSFGEFTCDKKVTHRVFIEARTIEESNEKASSLGIYFDGVTEGIDCPCCGDRWCEPDEIRFPFRYGTFDRKEARKIAEKYNTDFSRTTFKFVKIKKSDKQYDVVFRDVVLYATYLKDSHESSSVSPDAIIYYHNGKIRKI